MKLIFYLAILIVLVSSRTYPLYKQCDAQWASQQFSTSSKIICQAGSLITSVAMALKGIGQNYNPGTLNSWLKANDGFKESDFLWESVNKLGLSYAGKITN
jgi:hypothetical protein